MKAKDMLDLAYSSGEREEVSECGIPLPPQPFYGGSKESSNENRIRTQPTPTHREKIKEINQIQKKKNTKSSI
jgi:hypothetical protein